MPGEKDVRKQFEEGQGAVGNMFTRLFQASLDFIRGLIKKRLADMYAPKKTTTSFTTTGAGNTPQGTSVSADNLSRLD